MTALSDRQTPDALVVSNDLAELGRVGAWVRAWAREHNIPVRTTGRVDLCSAEAVTNIMMYAFTGCGPHEIALRLDRRGEVLALRIEDDGRAFDPRSVDPPRLPASLEEAQIGGLGVHLIRGLSDELRHGRSGGRNQLTLIFRLHDYDEPKKQDEAS